MVKKVKNTDNPRNMAPNNLFCDVCGRFRTPHPQTMVDHLVNKHGYDRRGVQAEMRGMQQGRR